MSPPCCEPEPSASARRWPGRTHRCCQLGCLSRWTFYPGWPEDRSREVCQLQEFVIDLCDLFRDRTNVSTREFSKDKDDCEGNCSSHLVDVESSQFIPILGIQCSHIINTFVQCSHIINTFFFNVPTTHKFLFNVPTTRTVLFTLSSKHTHYSVSPKNITSVGCQHQLCATERVN